MIPIAEKKGAVLPVYIFSTLLGIVLLFLPRNEQTPIFIIFGLIVIGISVGIIVDYLRLPSVVISKDSEGNLHLPKGIVLSPEELSDVSYRRASAKGVQYKWGTVTVTTRTARYRFRYIRDCEEVAKVLTDIMYGHPKSEPKEF